MLDPGALDQEGSGCDWRRVLGERLAGGDGAPRES